MPATGLKDGDKSVADVDDVRFVSIDEGHSFLFHVLVLQSVEIPVHSAPCNELIVSAGFDDMPLAEHNNSVGVPYGR